MHRSGTIALLAFAFMGLPLAFVIAQPPRLPPLDPLAEARARQQIADQKAEAEVLNALADADRQARTNPVKAVQGLKAIQVNVIDLSPVVSGDARRSLTDAITRKIAVIEGRPLTNPAVKPDPVGTAVRNDRKTAFESYTAELRDVKEGVDRYAKYKQSGLNPQAEQELARLAKSYPNNPSIIRLQEQDAFGGRVQESIDFANLQQKRIVVAMNDVMRSSLPAKGDVEFPADWKEKTARRLKTVELTDAEKKIIEALNKPVNVNWNGRPLDEALQDLSNEFDQKLFLDKRAIEDLGIDLRKGVNLQANGVSARTVLRQVLASQGLTFVIKDQVIQVTDVEKAKNMLTTRVYYLGDVVQGVGPFAGALTWGPYVDFQQTMTNVDTIVKAITTSIDPLCWKERGGPCSVTFHFPSMSIIVRASAEVHATIGSKMGGGR